MDDYLVSLSFAEERRGLVAEVAERLASGLGRDRVFFYPWHEAKLARPELDVLLQTIYHDQSRLIVVFLDRHYSGKKWAGTEWRAIRDLIHDGRADRVMLCRLDDSDLRGFFSTDGYVDAKSLEPSAIADLIRERLRTMGLFDGSLPDARRPRQVSRTTLRLAALGAVFLLLYGVFLAKSWQELPWGSPVVDRVELGIEADTDALNLLAEALEDIHQDRFEPADRALVEAAKCARTQLVQDRITTLQLLLASALSEGHQMAGEALAEGQKRARDADKTRYAGLAVAQGMQAFKWAKRASDALGTLGARQLPDVRFPGIELSHPLGEASVRGIEARQRITEGRANLAATDLDDAVHVLVAQLFRFYVARALAPEVDNSEIVARSLWSGSVHWYPGLTDALGRHLVRMADKGVQMVRAIGARPPEARFSVGRSFGLGEDLSFAYFHSVLENLRRFLVQAEARAENQEAVHLTALREDVDRRLLDIAQRARR